MPLIVGDYEWNETETVITLKLAIKSRKHKTDITYTSTYVKVSSPPHFAEFFLKNSIDPDLSFANFQDGTIVFHLTKQVPGLWGDLCDTLRDKTAVLERRQLELKRVEENELKKRKAKKEKERELKSFAVSQQIKVQEESRKAHEEWLKREERAALAELFANKNSDDDLKNSGPNSDTPNRKGKKSKVKANPKTKASVPPPRQKGQITVTFTPRAFPTPARESQVDAEQQFLTQTKENEKTRKTSETSDDSGLDNEEAEWEILKEKADSLFDIQKYQDAVEVYNEAIQLAPNIASLLSNRAAAYLKLGKLDNVVSDCTEALELMKETNAMNPAPKIRCLIRRGTAYVYLKDLGNGLADYEAALQLDSSNTAVKRDVEKIRSTLVKLVPQDQ